MLRIFSLIALMVVWLPVVQAQQPASPSNSDMASVWTDPATGLIWTKNDNDSDVNWNQASAYCANLRLGGNSDWRLPTIDELQGIYDPSISVTVPCGNGGSCTETYHVKGNLKLSGWQWSRSAGNSSGEAWHFNFYSGGRGSDLLNCNRFDRALCVRCSGE